MRKLGHWLHEAAMFCGIIVLVLVMYGVLCFTDRHVSEDF